jgi:protein TilB
LQGSDCTRAQELVYLNVALNNLTAIDHLQRCESLQKLDLSVNFIDASGLSSVTTLQHNTGLRELHLLGNPCTSWARHRKYVACVLPQLETLVSPPADRVMQALDIAVAVGFR